jgi:hypothetical protein
MRESPVWRTFGKSSCAYQLKDRAFSRQESADMLSQWRNSGTGYHARAVRSRMADQRIVYLIYVRPRGECEE